MTEDMDARARVKRLEAENARLRDQAEEMAKRQAITQYWLDRANSTISAMSLEKALATPSPESEPEQCSHGRVQGNGSGYMCVDCGHRFTSMFDRDAHPTPEQTDNKLYVCIAGAVPMNPNASSSGETGHPVMGASGRVRGTVG